MKIMKIVGKIFTVTLLILVAYSCQKTSGTGVLIVKMVDQPAEFDSVNVEVVAVQIHYSNDSLDESGWIDLETNVGIYNLLDLQDGVTAVLTDPATIPVGKLQQMRLILGDENTVVVEDETFPLGLSSQDKNGLKINLKSTPITEGDTVEITFDFDALKSIVIQGNDDDRFKLKPVVKLEEVIYY